MLNVEEKSMNSLNIEEKSIEFLESLFLNLKWNSSRFRSLLASIYKSDKIFGKIFDE